MIYLGWVFILTGMFFIISGIIALFRFPDFYTKLHAGGVIESCGMPVCLLGLAFIQTDYSSMFKLLAMALLVFLLNPVSTYALGRASLIYKIDARGKIK